MTRSYIQKRVTTTTTTTIEDTPSIVTEISSECHCGRRRVMKKSTSRLLLALVLAALFTSVRSSSSQETSSTVSSSYMQGHIASFLADRDYAMDDDEDYKESEQDPHDLEEQRKMYQQQMANYSQNDDHSSREHVSIQELPVDTTRAPLMSKCGGGSCLDRQSRENEALDAFKKTLLLKLGMERLPNVTKIKKLPDFMLEGLCRQQNWPIEYCTGKPSNNKNLEYQSDDPGSYGHDQVIEQEEDVQFMSSENRIYAFPQPNSRARHLKSYLRFKFDESQENNNVVAHASLNLFLNSRKSLGDKSLHDVKAIDIEIHEQLETGKHTSLSKVYSNFSVPTAGDGQYVQLDVSDMIKKWFQSHNTTHGIVIKVKSTADGTLQPHKFVALEPSNVLKRPFLDILPRDIRKKRTKRSSYICPKDSPENRCCRHPLTVDFEKFGWDWIIAPKRYDANYCAGECQIAFMQRYAHTHVVQLSTAANPCCSPRKMSPMQLLYFDSNLNIILGTIPHMIVEDCFCS